MTTYEIAKAEYNRLGEHTRKKLEAGYMKASIVLKDYLPDTNEATRKLDKLKAIAAGNDPEETEQIEDYLLNDFTESKNFQWYTVRQCNLLITHRVAEEKRTPPGNCIQTGQANRPNGLPYARIYTHKKTGRNYVVKTGY